MKKILLLSIIAILIVMPTEAKRKTVKLRIVETTDVHGSFFPYDFINGVYTEGSLASVSTFVDSLRARYGQNVLLLDNGDILQGQPCCYYYNYIAQNEMNIAAQVTNYLRYDVQNLGNHDIETGHDVYDKWVEETNAQTVCANVIDTETGKPYFRPYTIIMRDSVKIAVLGLLTPAIPNWLDEQLWTGMRFEEMVSSAKKWMDYIQANEHPDVVIGLFHAGREGGITTDEYEEDATERVAREVPGFDVIFYGHDHIRNMSQVKTADGSSTWIVDPSNKAKFVGYAEIDLKTRTSEKNGFEVLKKTVKCELKDVRNEPEDTKYMTAFTKQLKKVNTFVDRRVGYFKNNIYTRDCFFGNSALTDLIQSIQLKLTGADVSFTAPLEFNNRIAKGELHVSDMFKLYKYENKLCVLKMTGEEIRRHLEMSYDQWVNTMKSPEDHIMLLSEQSKYDQQRLGFKNLTFNFDSASGIDYEVDVRKPDGQKVDIIGFSNGEPFELDGVYTVAMSSYRANGGGELLTRGAGLTKEELKSRLIWQSDKDLRYYLMQELEKQGTLDPQPKHNWEFVPDSWTEDAIERDKNLLFGIKE